MTDCCNRPHQFHVISVAATAALVTLTVDKLFTTMGVNEKFRLCIDLAQIPAANTGTVSVTDGTTTLVVLQPNGNNLRADSLRRFLCKNANGGCCRSFNFCAFRGNDPDHVTLFSRFCPSAFVPAATVVAG